MRKKERKQQERKKDRNENRIELYYTPGCTTTSSKKQWLQDLNLISFMNLLFYSNEKKPTTNYDFLVSGRGAVHQIRHRILEILCPLSPSL